MKGERNDGAADHSVMRRVNHSLVLERIRRRSSISRAELARETSLAKPTVSLIVDELLSDGTIREIGVGPAPASGGRPPVLLEFNARSEYVGGIQVGVKQTTIVVADALGEELNRTVIDTPNQSAEHALEVMSGEMRNLMRSVGAPKKRLKAVGVCVPGLVDAHTGICLLAPNLKWRDVPVSDLLRDELGVPIFVVNRADAALALESIDGVAEGAKDVVLLYVGRGVGASMITDGRLVRGNRGLSGVIGHCTVPGLTTRCTCGKVGCLETVADAVSIARTAEAALKAGRASVLSKDLEKQKRLTADDVAAAAEAEDELAIDVLAEAGRALGLASSWMVNLFDPQVLVVAGPVADAGEPLLGPLRYAVMENALSHNVEDLRIASWRMGRDAGVSGAVLVALQGSEDYYRVSSTAEYRW